MKGSMLLAVVAACGSEASPAEDASALSAEHSALRVGARRLDNPTSLGDAFYTVTVFNDGFECLVTDETLTATWNGVPMTIVTHARGSRTQCTFLELAVARADVGGDALIEVSDQHGAIDATFSVTAFDTGTTVPVTPRWELPAGGFVTFNWSDAVAREAEPELCFLAAARWCVRGDAYPELAELRFSIPAVPASEGIARLSGIGTITAGPLRCDAASCQLSLDQETTRPAIVLTSSTVR